MRGVAAGREAQPEPVAEPDAVAEEAPPPEPSRLPRRRPRREAAESRSDRKPASPQPRRDAARPERREEAGAASGRSTRRQRGPEAIMRRAVERFNSSEERRKVAGLIRSLGEPQAACGRTRAASWRS